MAEISDGLYLQGRRGSPPSPRSYARVAVPGGWHRRLRETVAFLVGYHGVELFRRGVDSGLVLYGGDCRGGLDVQVVDHRSSGPNPDPATALPKGSAVAEPVQQWVRAR
jgi:hypothetical protein